jgi:transcriptional regulator with XRE-family HTH domain
MEQREPGKRPNELGAWGRRAADNIADLRERAGMTQAMLADAVTRMGRTVNRVSVGKTETGDRRIDADDLAAFAIAIGVTPNRLLLSGTASAEAVIEVRPGRLVSELDAWQWALGEKPLDKGNEREFVAENRPSHAPESPLASKVFEHPELVRAINRTASQARKLGVSLPELYLATAYAYLTQGGN